jgi:hypothetical protein
MTCFTQEGVSKMKTRMLMNFATIALTILLLNACVSQPTMPAPTQQPSTSIPPTQTLPTATQTVEPTATFEPEVQADNIEAILGTWNLGAKGSSGLSIDYLILSKNGSYSWEVGKPLTERVKKGQVTDSGKYWFEGKQLKFESTKGCFDRDLKNFSCVGVYEVYITVQGDNPVALRLVKVEDEHYYRALVFPGPHTIVIEL